MQGRVKFYNTAKGFGFIFGDDGQQHFFHISRVNNREELQEGDTVSFETELSAKSGKLQAVTVRRLQHANGDDYSPAQYGQAFFERDGGPPDT